ncbi:MAG: LLM class F420-dependent oxidoreductase [Acidimicrobiales bacterium]
MKFGVMFSNVAAFAEPEGARALATTAEEVGFESIWTVEHAVVPKGYESAYPYSASGKMPGGEFIALPDPFVWLSYVAALTSTIKLGTGIAILPQRNPVIAAKEVASLDRLSNGRVLLGVGAGWLAEEFAALGVPFERRGDRLDEYIKALRVLWSDESPTFSGEFVSFTDCVCLPQPTAGSVPIVIGGHTPRAARRAGELGDGFFPGSAKPDELATLLDIMRRSAKGAGRDPDAIEITVGGGFTVEQARTLADLGVDRALIAPMAFDAEGIRRQLTTFAEEVIGVVNTPSG